MVSLKNFRVIFCCVSGVVTFMPLQLPLDIDRIEASLRFSLLLSGPCSYIRISATFLSFLDTRDCCNIYLTCYCLYYEKPELNLFRTEIILEVVLESWEVDTPPVQSYPIDVGATGS